MSQVEWRPLFKLGAVCALSVLGLMAIQMVVFVVWPFPAEGAVVEWFAIFDSNWLRGLLTMDLLMLLDYLLLVPVYLALYAALRGVSLSWTLLATTLFLLGAAAFLSSNSCFECSLLAPDTQVLLQMRTERHL
jgi:hypothetical protein